MEAIIDAILKEISKHRADASKQERNAMLLAMIENGDVKAYRRAILRRFIVTPGGQDETHYQYRL